MLGKYKTATGSKTRRLDRLLLNTSIVLFIAGTYLFFSPADSTISHWINFVIESDGIVEAGAHQACPVYEPIKPASFLGGSDTVFKVINDGSFRESSAAKLSGAVQVDTTVEDNLPDVPDAPEKWIHFKKFQEYLEKTFPSVFANLHFETVNTHGILLIWEGQNADLKPLLLLAHQDVVPVQKDTIDDWSHPPFSGHYNGKFLFGRGASDCKNLLIGLMETVELLISDEFVPQRSVILSFGFDEEANGVRGAASLSKFLEAKYGRDSIYAILDEGAGIIEQDGHFFGIPAVAEKGYIDISVELTTPGGHSSVPPDHTNIGIMSDLVVAIEQDPYEPLLDASSPILQLMQCVAANSNIDKELKKNIMRAGYDKVANSKVVRYISSIPTFKYLIRTSQSVDIVRGGAKSNALPEHTSLIINHRIAVESSVDAIKSRFLERVVKIAKEYNLGIRYFGEDILPATNNGYFEVKSYSGTWLDPAPVSPSSGKIWEFLAGTTRHVFEDIVFPNLTSAVVIAPALMPANTDTRHYWNLTKNIYRYTPAVSDQLNSKIHSVDENIEFDSHLQLIAFFYEYIQNINSVDAGN